MAFFKLKFAFIRLIMAKFRRFNPRKVYKLQNIDVIRAVELNFGIFGIEKSRKISHSYIRWKNQKQSIKQNLFKFLKD